MSRHSTPDNRQTDRKKIQIDRYIEILRDRQIHVGSDITV